MVVPTTMARGSVPGSLARRAPKPVVARAEKKITKKPEVKRESPFLEEIVSSSVTEEDEEISSGDVDSQLKELEPKAEEDVFHDVTDVDQLRARAAVVAEVGWVIGCSTWWKWNAIYFGSVLLSAMVSLAVAVYLKLRLDGLDLGPPPT